MPRPLRLLSIYLLLLFLLIPWNDNQAVAQQETTTPTPTIPSLAITSPLLGQAIQGSLVITGFTALEGFQSSELEFRYSSDTTGTWFLISDSTSPVSGGELATWDTTTITDGNYLLRLTVFKQDGSQQEVTVTGLRVRNYTPVETSTPTPPIPTSTPLPGLTPPPTATFTPTASPIPPTPTPLPPNPIQLSNPDLIDSLVKGVLAVLASFALLGLLVTLQRFLRR